MWRPDESSSPFSHSCSCLGGQRVCRWRSRWQREAMSARCCVLFPKQHSVTNTGVLTNGVDVMYEHLVIYTSTNGETANDPIVSVHKVSDRKVSLSEDHWDLNAIANTTWFQSAAAGDLSWVVDATGLG